jgi:hypothetical protein
MATKSPLNGYNKYMTTSENNMKKLSSMVKRNKNTYNRSQLGLVFNNVVFPSLDFGK